MTPEGPTKKQLLAGTLAALIIGSLVVTLGILPAEFGVDPTGFGAATGITKIKGIQPEATTQPEDASSATSSGFTPTATVTRPRFAVTWTTKAATQPAQEGYLAQGEEASLSFPLDVPNIESVIATAAWIDANETAGQQTEPDIFEIQITAPDGRASTTILGRNLEPGGPGNATATLDWRALPPPLEFEATNEPGARAELAKRVPDDTTANGEWTVRVKLVDAGGTRPTSPAPLPVGVPTSAPDDAGNDWNVTVTVTTYAPLLTQKATETRNDETTLTIGPGQGVEYKLHMSLGQALDYAWKADQPLYFDFHGEKDGDASAFTTHKKGTQATDSGNFTSPFTGKQGWYFENRNGAPASVTLKTSGYYVVLGKK